MAGDFDFANVSLLLNMQGTHGSTAIIDSGPLGLTPSATGGATLSTSFAPVPGGSSLKITGSGSQLQYATNSAWEPTTEALTIEAIFMLPAIGGGRTLLSTYREGDAGFILNATGSSLALNLSGDGVDISGGTLTAGVWHHAAFSGEPGSYKLFLDGTQVGSTYTGTVKLPSGRPLSVGGFIYRGAWYDLLNGYIAGVRVTKGVARYTAGFTPPDAPFPGGATLTGTVRDATGALAARKVVAYREDTGTLIGTTTSDATTGVYSIETPADAAHTLVFYPALGESLNALVLRGVLPIGT